MVQYSGSDILVFGEPPRIPSPDPPLRNDSKNHGRTENLYFVSTCHLRPCKYYVLYGSIDADGQKTRILRRDVLSVAT